MQYMLSRGGVHSGGDRYYCPQAGKVAVDSNQSRVTASLQSTVYSQQLPIADGYSLITMCLRYIHDSTAMNSSTQQIAKARLASFGSSQGAKAKRGLVP